MDERQCGHTGLRVSDLGLGTYTWGRDTDPLEATDMLTHFVDAGGTLVECAPTHGDGMAVDALSQAMTAVGRHRIILAWRGASRPTSAHTWVPSAGRGDMLRSLDDTLSRLGTDYVDLWIGEFDPAIPIEETLETLEAARRSGRAHYVGLSHPSQWDFACSVTRAALNAGPAITVVEDEVNLLNAQRTRPLIDRATGMGIGVFAHSPLAMGVLTGKYRHSTPPDSRAASPHLRHLVEPYLQPEFRGIVEAVVRAGEGLERTPTDVALAWVRHAAGITSTIIGPRTLRQLDPLLESEVSLPDPIRQVLNEVAGLTGTQKH
ncbi:aldo/keto reductase [Schaalia sp. ZJ405]|uniref:aldo/keto reductase n=1 Tax=Schaalia sp. ZJ405 TaxID=2709403 RepID=UPI0013EDEADC|nr:aldo/keto reductase [Schaalia sp. ZJ405]QPK82067.1 aldo/keto reductase [Schaalia sp. ZJ405]